MAIYIDPNSPTNGVGTTADPKNTWDGITLVANETYRQKRGTVCTLPSGASKYIHANTLASAVTTPLTLEAYFYADGSDEPSLPRPKVISQITTNGVGTVNLRKSSNVIVRNLHISCVVSSTYAVEGILVQAQNTGAFSGIEIDNCEIENHARGIQLRTSSTDTDSSLDSVTITNNDIHNNLMGIGWWLYNKTNSYLTRVSIVRNQIHDNGGLDRRIDINSPGGITGNYGNGMASDPTVCNDAWTIEDNDIYRNQGYPLALSQARDNIAASVIRNNRIYDNNHLTIDDSHGLFVAACYGTIVEGNSISNNWGYAPGPNGTACGIIIDTSVADSMGGDRVRVRRNILDGGWPGYTFGGGTSESSNAQAGIFVIDNTNCSVTDNVIRGFHSGIGTYANTGGAVPRYEKLNGLVIEHNTITDLLESESLKTAVGISLSAGQTTIVRNNVLSNCRQGIWQLSALTAVTEYANCIHAPRNGHYFVRSATIDVMTPDVALHASDTTGAPMLDANDRPLEGSPLIHAGTHTGYRNDITGRLRNNPPSIGAYEYVDLASAA